VIAAGTAALVLSRSSSSPPLPRYGGLPAWLPKAKVPVDRLVHASPAHPWLAIEGDTVAVRLAAGRALVTAVGPRVPEEGKFPVPATSPCTFLVTFAASSGAIPLRSGDFTILDELGHLHHPHITTQGGAPLPADVPTGSGITLRISGVLPTGNGQLRWAPAGAKPVVSWDFDVEID
jgi:hypothetical protein